MAYELHHTRRGPPRHRRSRVPRRSHELTYPSTGRHRRDICRGSHTLGPSSTPRRGGGRSKATSHGTHTESASGFQGQTLGKAVEKLLGTYGFRRQKPGG